MHRPNLLFCSQRASKNFSASPRYSGERGRIRRALNPILWRALARPLCGPTRWDRRAGGGENRLGGTCVRPDLAQRHNGLPPHRPFGIIQGHDKLRNGVTRIGTNLTEGKSRLRAQQGVGRLQRLRQSRDGGFCLRPAQAQAIRPLDAHRRDWIGKHFLQFGYASSFIGRLMAATQRRARSQASANIAILVAA